MRIADIPPGQFFVIAETTEFIKLRLERSFYCCKYDDIEINLILEELQEARVLSDKELKDLLSFDNNELEIWKNDRRRRAAEIYKAAAQHWNYEHGNGKEVFGR